MKGMKITFGLLVESPCVRWVRLAELLVEGILGGVDCVAKGVPLESQTSR
jgi:hypothetical protein